MKTKTLSRAALCIAMASCLITFTMCKKTSSSDTPPDNTSGQRITGYAYYYNDVLEGTAGVTYNGNLITEILEKDPSGAELNKETIQYNGNSIASVTSYFKESGPWLKGGFDEVVGYSGDNPLEIISHSFKDGGAETGWDKRKYIYEGALLKKMEDYYIYSGICKLGRTTIYTYDNSGKILHENDTTQSNGYFTSYTYTAEHMTEALRSNLEWGNVTNDRKTTYEYANNRLSKETDYNWTAGAWVKEWAYSYEYNQSGNVVRLLQEDFVESYLSRVEINYGAGSGNYAQYMKASGMEDYLPGNPTPNPVKSPGRQQGFQHESKHVGR